MWLHGAAAVVWRVRHAVLRRNVSGGVDVPDREPPADSVSWRAQRVSLRPHAVTDRGRPERPAILARGVSSRLGVLIVATACAIATTTVRSGHADDGSLLESWLAQRTATGTWGGARDDLEQRGVTVELSYAADFAGNVSGGERRGSGYAGFAVAGLGVDLEKLMSLHGAALILSGLWASGRDVSEEFIGNLFP